MNDVDKQNVARFKQALYASHGKTNNGLAYNMIKETDVSTEDVVRIAGQVGNDKFTDCYSYPEHSLLCVRRTQKYVNKNEKNVGRKLVSLKDYAWYFGRENEEVLPDLHSINNIYDGNGYKNIDGVKFTMDKVLSSGINNPSYKKDVDTNVYAALQLRKTLQFMNSNSLPSGAVKRLKEDEGAYKEALGIDIGDGTTCGNFGLEHNYRIPRLYRIGETDEHKIKQYIDICARIYSMEKLMQNELKNDSVYKEDSFHNDISSTIVGRLNDWRKVDEHIQKLFKLMTTFDIMLNMGIGIYSCSYRRTSYSRLSRVQTRSRTVYKRFMNAKTVDERKNLRDLLVKQLNIIAADFVGNEYRFSILPCAEEQDAEFEKKNAEKKTKKVSNAKKAKGITNGATKVNINELSTVSTTAVCTGR